MDPLRPRLGRLLEHGLTNQVPCISWSAACERKLGHPVIVTGRADNQALPWSVTGVDREPFNLLKVDSRKETKNL